MPRRRVLRSLVAVAAVLALVLVAVVALGATVVRRPLPDHAGSATLAGLDGEVRVLRDARGVPSIYASSPEDLYRAQGYVHAQDRFFEMDLRRHVTAGRLSELVGESADALEADSVIRTLGWRRVAEQEWELLGDEARRYLQAYADGVNAYLEGRDTGSLAVEYTVLDLQVDVAEPEPWDPVDSLAWLKAMAWDLRANYDDELARAETYGTVRDVARVDELFPRSDGAVPIVPAAAETVAAPVVDARVTLGGDLQRALDRAREALEAVPHLLGEGDGLGSNSWVVAGEHTASGLPLLANDPHLGLTAPGVWSQVGLYCEDVGADCPVAVSGFGFAGFPGVVIGHNGALAWGMTNMGADVTDLFLERVDTEAGTYLRDGEQVPLDVRTETIEVAGGDSVEIEVRSTVHGPLVSGVLPVGRAVGSPVPDGGRGATEVALAWTALEPGRTAEGVFALATAATAQDMAAVAEVFAVPAQNLVFATTDGHIGYQAPGRIPVRARVTGGPVPSDGTWPRPGWDSRYDWQGYVPADELPAVLDPAEGYLVAANQVVTGPGAGVALTQDWDHGYRAERIRALLAEAVADGTPLDAAAMSRIQLDAANPFAEVLVPALLAAPVADSFTAEAVDLLAGWDRVSDADSAPAAYFAQVWATLLELTFADDLPESQWPDGGDRWLSVVTALLQQPDSPWWDDRRTLTVVESRDEILARALAQARLELTVELGKEPADWQWGRLHVLALQHEVLGGEGVPAAVRRLVNPSPIGVGGGSAIVDATSWDAASGSFEVTAGPSMRMVVDLADLDASTWVTVSGTSGHPGSVHYTDQLQAWAAGETYPWPFGADAVADAAVRELTLRPAS